MTLEGNKALLVDPYTGAIIGEPPAALRSFFRTMTMWHRYIALDGASRATGKLITGAANLGFLFIVVSGLYLWFPRVWTWIQFKNVLWFRRGLAPKARDFNWHNVIGFWSAVPLADRGGRRRADLVPWASNLVYRLAGDTPPARASRAGASRAARPKRTRCTTPTVLDARGRRHCGSVPAWRTITTRLAADEKAPVVITVDDGYAGQPQKRQHADVRSRDGGSRQAMKRLTI